MKLNLEQSDTTEIETKKIATVAHVIQISQNLVILRCPFFSEDPREID